MNGICCANENCLYLQLLHEPMTPLKPEVAPLLKAFKIGTLHKHSTVLRLCFTNIWRVLTALPFSAFTLDLDQDSNLEMFFRCILCLQDVVFGCLCSAMFFINLHNRTNSYFERTLILRTNPSDTPPFWSWRATLILGTASRLKHHSARRLVLFCKHVLLIPGWDSSENPARFLRVHGCNPASCERFSSCNCQYKISINWYIPDIIHQQYYLAKVIISFWNCWGQKIG